ncbi:L-fuconate dehydratase [Rhodococcus opacus]|uniref:L-fuconate dehydratase n=1 Tax=Rhodococcus opacus TaxID=37919 RepID=A0A1B1K5W7_RHOOP|nr:L-fuconate dehydratase [Rhodococcus opacus]
MIKLKVGGSIEDDLRRLALAREAVGDLPIAIDANQRWEVPEAIEWVNRLAQFDPYWIEEPTSTDDILGHADIRKGVSPTRVATGEAVANRIVFKQLLQAQAIDVLQLDSTRVAGVNENIATMLLAARFGVPVCPHAGGVGLCELVQHFSFFDYAAVSGSQEGRMIEYVDHLHEHFVEPVRIVRGRYAAPTRPGIGAEMLAASRDRWVFPTGASWDEVNGRAATTTSDAAVVS